MASPRGVAGLAALQERTRWRSGRRASRPRAPLCRCTAAAGTFALRCCSASRPPPRRCAPRPLPPGSCGHLHGRHPSATFASRGHSRRTSGAHRLKAQGQRSAHAMGGARANTGGSARLRRATRCHQSALPTASGHSSRSCCTTAVRSSPAAPSGQSSSKCDAFPPPPSLPATRAASHIAALWERVKRREGFQWSDRNRTARGHCLWQRCLFCGRWPPLWCPDKWATSWFLCFHVRMRRHINSSTY